MKIIIVGGGKLGSALTRQLSAEACDITLIDLLPEALETNVEDYDVITLQGNGASMQTLRDAQVGTADLLIATTGRDEVNLLCCMTAHAMNRNLHTIARIRNPEYGEQARDMREVFGLSLIVNPERQAAVEIDRLLKFPGFLRCDTFANGRVEIVELQIPQSSPLANIPLSRLNTVTGQGILVCAVVRSGKVIAPGGNFVLLPGDNIFVTGTRKNLTLMLKNLGIVTRKVKHVVILGGGTVSYYLASILEKSDTETEIIELREDRCRYLAEVLPKTTVIHGDASQPAFLDRQGIAGADALVALTGLDELNVVLSLYGESKEIPQRITKLGRFDYSKILENINVGSAISPKELTSSIIVRYVRAMRNQTGAAITIHSIANGQAEAMEFLVDDSTRHCGEALRNIHLKKGILVAGISHAMVTEIPNGDSSFARGDHVVLVCSDRKVLYSLNDIFDD